MSYQKVTGTLNPGAHPGSYNGQDAYNDMLVTGESNEQRGGLVHGISTGQRRNCAGGGCPCLNASHEQPIYLSDRKGHNGMTDDGTATTLNAQEKERPLVGRSIVRRLTPHECLLLQGYPMDWCDIGDYTDENGRIRKEADTAKYKAAGNSIALPFWAWLFRRINAYYERQATMGSLFDGIGGFPLTAIRNGIKPLWASEIEAFPIAVCKKHFGDEDARIEGDIYKYL